MSTRFIDIMVSTTVNLALWLVGTVILYDAKLGTQFWLLMCLICALFGGVLGRFAVAKLVPPFSERRRPLTIMVGVMPVFAAFAYLVVVRSIGQGTGIWLLYLVPVVAALAVLALLLRLRQRRALQDEDRLRKVYEDLSIIKA